jgi:hypothetical protein
MCFFCLIHKRKCKEWSSILDTSYPKDLSLYLIREFYKIDYWWSCPCLATEMYLRQLLYNDYFIQTFFLQLIQRLFYTDIFSPANL